MCWTGYVCWQSVTSSPLGLKTAFQTWVWPQFTMSLKGWTPKRLLEENFFFKFSSFVHVQKQLRVSGFLSRFLRSQLPTSCKHFCKSYSSCSKAVPNMTPWTHCPKWEKREVSCLQLQPLPKLRSCSVWSGFKILPRHFGELGEYFHVGGGTRSVVQTLHGFFGF